MDRTEENDRLLGMPALDIDTDGAFERFVATAAKQRVRPSRGMRLVAPPVKWLAAAATVAIVATTLSITGVADSILQIFEVKQFAAITVTPTDLQTLEQLSAFGTLTWSDKPTPHQVASLAAATAESGLPAVSVTVPASVTATARYGVLARTTATFKFDAAKARASAVAAGRTAPPMPAKLDGSSLVVTAGPAISITYGEPDKSGSGNALVVVVAKALTVASDGASVSELQAYLLSQPGISPALAAQIRAIGDPTSTLPVPIPVAQATSKTVSVHGTSGLFIGDSTGLGSGVIWQQNGLVYLVGGTLTESQTLTVANSLR